MLPRTEFLLVACEDSPAGGPPATCPGSEKQAPAQDLDSIFAFTEVARFFAGLIFKEWTCGELPPKAWEDCLDCPEFQAWRLDTGVEAIKAGSGQHPCHSANPSAVFPTSQFFRNGSGFLSKIPWTPLYDCCKVFLGATLF